MHRAVTPLLLLAILAGCVLLPGCFRTEVLRPEALLADSSWDLVVLTRDGRRIVLKEGNYHAQGAADSLVVLQGQGELVQTESPYTATEYNGTISLNDSSVVMIKGGKVSGWVPYVLSGLGALVLLFGLLISHMHISNV